MNTTNDTSEARLAQDRIRNSTRVALDPKGGPDIAAIGTQGAIAYALLDVANAIRGTSKDEQTKSLLNISDALVEAIREGADQKVVQRISEQFEIERKGFNVDQHRGLTLLDSMKGP
jgi:hypothetical protein